MIRFESVCDHEACHAAVGFHYCGRMPTRVSLDRSGRCYWPRDAFRDGFSQAVVGAAGVVAECQRRGLDPRGDLDQLAWHHDYRAGLVALRGDLGELQRAAWAACDILESESGSRTRQMLVDSWKRAYADAKAADAKAA